MDKASRRKEVRIVEETIKNYDSYTSGMKKSSVDKLFWMNKIDKINTVVDFGCADGTLIREMNSEMPDLQYIGYDNSKAMISLAEQGHLMN